MGRNCPRPFHAAAASSPIEEGEKESHGAVGADGERGATYGGWAQMVSREEQAERIEALQNLLDRLCSPDLTLCEAKTLRGSLVDLIKRDDRGPSSRGAAGKSDFC